MMNDELQGFITQKVREAAEREAADIEAQACIMLACGFSVSELTILRKAGEPPVVMPVSVTHP